jgi:hypothetical protein
MSDDNRKQIARYDDSSSLREIIDNPMKYLTPQQRQELTGKAAELGLELQVDAAKKKLKHQAGWSDVDQFTKQHFEISQTSGFTSHKMSGDFEVASGRVRIEAKKGGCFVATAVYGSELVPEVIYLRFCRDHVLRKSQIGRRFIAWYYRHGPRYASFLERHQSLKPLARACRITPFG